jgi:dTMP kinase
LFIALDGIDGAGKTSQLDRMEQWLSKRNREVVRVRDPGSTLGGEAIRTLLLDSDLTLHRRCEALLYMAARCQLVEERIRPALAEGKIVLCDRFLLATVAYQSVGGNVTANELWQLGGLALHGLQPDLTVLLDLPAAVAYQRLKGPADRMERRGIDYLESVRQEFLRQVHLAGKRYVTVDATADVESVWKDIERDLVRLLNFLG